MKLYGHSTFASNTHICEHRFEPIEIQLVALYTNERLLFEDVNNDGVVNCICSADSVNNTI